MTTDQIEERILALHEGQARSALQRVAASVAEGRELQMTSGEILQAVCAVLAEYELDDGK